MKTLLTGASGFVGGHLLNYLKDQGLDVHVLVRDPSSIKNLPKSHIHQGDITNLEDVLEASRECHSIFHLAGVVGYSKAQRSLMEHVNVGGTQNILKAIQTHKVSKLLHFSSVVAIGASHTPVSLNEDSPYNIAKLNLGYFETKRRAEIRVKEEAQKGHFECVIVNPSTIYGYGDATKGSRKVQIKVAQGRFPIYPPGGANIIAVEDVVSTTFQAWKKGRNLERYILSGENLYIRQIFEMIAKEAQVSPPKIPMPPWSLHALGKAGDILESFGKKGPVNSETAWTSTLYHWFDNEKSKKELGLNPKPAKEAIKNSVQWMRDHGLLRP